MNFDVILILLVFFGLLFYHFMTQAPSSDLVFRSRSDDEVIAMREYLAANGIKTFIKANDLNRFVLGGDLASPSLHVIDPDDYENAIDLVTSRPPEQGQRSKKRTNRRKELTSV
jgi:hypothetical protein